MEACNGKIARKIGAVRGQKHRRALDVCLLDRRDFVGDGKREKVRPIHYWIIRIGVHWIERDFVFLRILAVQVTSDLDSRFEPLFNAPLVPQILLVLRERFGLNVSAEVLELLWPFIGKFDRQENHTARNSGKHVPPIGAISSHL